MNSPTADRAHVARLRKEVDALDLHLLEVLAERAALVLELSAHKCALGIPVRDPEREREMAELHARWAEQLNLPHHFVSELFAVVLRCSRELQEGLRGGAVRYGQSSSARKIRA